MAGERKGERNREEGEERERLARALIDCGDDEHLDGLYFVLNPLCNLGFLYIFLAYFWLIWLFCRYTDEKWRLERFSGEKRPYFSKLKIIGQ